MAAAQDTRRGPKLAIVFDFFDVLATPRPTPELMLGIPAAEYEAFVTSDEIEGALNRGTLSDSGLWAKVFERFKAEITAARPDLVDGVAVDSAVRAMPWPSPLNADMYRLVDQLKAAGYAVAVASNVSVDLAAQTRAVSGAYEPFEPNVFLSYEMGVDKSAAEFFVKIADSMGVTLAALVFIDDRSANLEVASGAGVPEAQLFVFTTHDQLVRDLKALGVSVG